MSADCIGTSCKASAMMAQIATLAAERDALLKINARFAKRNLADMERMFVLEQERDALRADAERYRWLRDTHPADGGLWVAMGVPYSPSGVACWRHEKLDAAIDAARKA